MIGRPSQQALHDWPIGLALGQGRGIAILVHCGRNMRVSHEFLLFNHIALGQEVSFLEYIPHLRDHFVFPAVVKDGRYRVPEEPGASCDLKLE